ncbi:MAG: glycosyltransferase [Gemmatimonadales bacterium]
MPALRYGGTERVVVWLARGLEELGHRVSVVCARGSRLSDLAFTTVDERAANRQDFDIAPFLPDDSDIVHYFVPIHVPPPIPHLWTMQGNARPGFDPGDRCVCVSADHARRHGSDQFVYNGIDPRDYRYQPDKNRRLLFLGRLHSVKGWRDAIEIASIANRPIVVAGGWRPTLRRGVRFVGKVGGERKKQLLAGSAALLMPLRWDEPFGLVVIEALVSGTPVIGRPRGALPELLTPDVGGLAETAADMAHLLGTRRWDPAACRARVLDNFTHIAMAEAYVRLYRRLLAGGSLRDQTSS